ncbi:MAG TPA: tetratricopeptide repeat protein [Candidatus Acidoferrum sp.]|nr:tetratricopeptide repeat protein [Candidatus Acidoferrum sp.]
MWSQLIDFAQKWREQDPSDHRALFYIGLGLCGLGQFAQAEAAYRHALTINPTDARVWNNLAGLLYEKLQRPAEGVRCLERALKINPDHKQSWSNLATMAGRLGRHQQALACANRALALDPKLVEAHLHKAMAAKALGKMDVVREVCQALASLDPEHFRRTR